MFIDATRAAGSGIFRARYRAQRRKMSVMASLSTAADLPAGEEGLRIVDESAFAVTFFSALEHVNPGQLDNDRYGIVVRSLERREKMGGALPRMPGIVNEWSAVSARAHQECEARVV